MGGSALKNVESRRLSRVDYLRAEHDAIQAIRTVVGPVPRLESILAYRTKQDFGDLDLLLEDVSLPPNLNESLAGVLRSREYAQTENSNVTSFDFDGFQVDVIVTPPELYDTSVNYFAWNDLGNLMGCVARKLGVHFGWDGLSYRLMDGTEQIDRIVVSRDNGRILTFLGYDPIRHSQGFDTPQEIFEYAASSRFFSPEIYLLENRNAKSRVRDAKRKTYASFLRWLKDPQGLAAFQEATGWTPQEARTAEGAEGGSGVPCDANLRRLRAEFPGCAAAIDKALADRARMAVFKESFNGEVVSRMTGLRYAALGAFMDDFREAMSQAAGGSFRNWALEQTPESLQVALQRHVAASQQPTQRKPTP